MPYNGKGYVKKQFGRAKKAIYKRYHTKSGNLNMAQMGKDIMWLKNAINSEKKQKTFNVIDTIRAHNSSNGHYVYALQGPAQSLKEDGRVGNQYKLTSIEVQMDFKNGPLATATDNTVHVFFFQILGDQLSGTEGQGGTIANRLFDDNNSGLIRANSFRNQESFKQIRILNYQKVYFKNSGDDTGAGTGARQESKYFLNLKKGNPYQHFEKDQPSSTDINKNKIYMLVISNIGNNTTTNYGVNVDLSYRVNYVDN